MVKITQLKKDLLKYILSYNISKDILQIVKTSQKLSECSFKMFLEITVDKNIKIQVFRKLIKINIIFLGVTFII